MDDKILSRLRDKFDQRLKSDPELKQLAQELSDFKKAKENTIVSLQEVKRRKERDEAEKKRAAVNKVAKTDTGSGDEGTTDSTKTAAAAPKKKKDVYLTETGRILADLIAFQQRQP